MIVTPKWVSSTGRIAARGGAGGGATATAMAMAETFEVDDPADPRLADYRDLRDVQMRKHLESEHGLFLAEGE
ncbi:MAG: hypothetical protein ABI193_06080, partial [Minicystis sp.]